MTRSLKQQPCKRNTGWIIGDKNIPLSTQSKSGAVHSWASLVQSQKKMGLKGRVHKILSPLKAGYKSLHTKRYR
ncbi:hypothetical protein I79_017806 [Cricetulus griseus]|uniref:Uncharacterized protein n=1 Tax=Cricetulus griseus TaxID=10029 RepID=G3I307_CRIGR|nr:hypothetical protein I79_017806 [Cricetulus griseus]